MLSPITKKILIEQIKNLKEVFSGLFAVPLQTGPGGPRAPSALLCSDSVLPHPPLASAPSPLSSRHKHLPNG